MKLRTLRSASLLLALLATAGLVSGPADAATVTVLRPGDDVGTALGRLRAGDTVRIAPGTYFLGLGLTAAPGTPSRPITVTALDPSRPPLLQGSLTLRRPDYWRLSYLRFQATDDFVHREALTIKGGIGWVVSRSEFFGAARTGAFANVAISNYDLADPATAPRYWQFTFNCVHDAGLGRVAGHNASTDHNLYVNASGDASGLVARNVMFNANAGENIKVGSGGDASRPGASNVRIEYNTLANAGRQILVFGRLTGSRIRGNLLVNSTAANAGVGVYLNNLSRPGSAVFGDNFGYRVDRTIYFPNSPAATFRDLGGNVLGRPGLDDPQLSGTGCGGFVPRNSAIVTRYGRTAR